MCHGSVVCDCCGEEMTRYEYSRARLKAVLEQRRELEAMEALEAEENAGCECSNCKEEALTRERISAIPIDDVSNWIEGKTKKPKTQHQREKKRSRRQKTVKLNQEVARFEKALPALSTTHQRLKLPSHTRDRIAQAFINVNTPSRRNTDVVGAL